MRELDCPNCGAHLTDYDPGTTVSCSYCGTRLATDARRSSAKRRPPEAKAKAKAKAKAESKSEHEAPNDTDAASARARVRSARKLLFGGMRWAWRWAWRLAWRGVTLIVALAVVASIYSGLRAANPDWPEIPGKQEALVVLGKLGLPPTRWDRDYGRPIFVQIDDRDAVVNRTNATMLGNTFFAEAYFIDDGERAWRIGPMPDADDAHHHVQVDVLDDEVFVTDPEGTLYVHGLEDGEYRREFTFRERIVDLCTPEPDDEAAPRRVWVGLADEEDLVLDPATMTTEEASERPAWCQHSRRGMRVPSALRKQRDRTRSGRQPREKGTSFQDYAVEGELGVARGIQSSGRRIPRLVGYDPKTGDISWSIDIAAIDLGRVREEEAPLGALFGPTYVTIYGEGRDAWRIAAFEASTGTRLWDHSMRNISMMNSVDLLGRGGEDLFFVERSGTIEFRRISDGVELSSVGGGLFGP